MDLNDDIRNKIDELRESISKSIADFVGDNQEYRVRANVDIHIYDLSDTDNVEDHQNKSRASTSFRVLIHNRQRTNENHREGVSRTFKIPWDTILEGKSIKKKASEMILNVGKDPKFMDRLKKDAGIYEIFKEDGIHHFIVEVGLDMREDEIDVRVEDDHIFINGKGYKLPFRVRKDVEIRSIKNGIADIILYKE